ncbi:MAG: hypothetical protein AAF741_14455 [Bacteroidota bacterium]
MRLLSIFLLLLSIMSCTEEIVDVPDFNSIVTESFMELTIANEVYSEFVSGDQSEIPWSRTSDQSYKGFSRNETASAVSFLGFLSSSNDQEDRSCYEIAPLTFNPENFLSNPGSGYIPTLFVEFIGLESNRSDCTLDSITLSEYFRLGNYPLGQQIGQVNLHLYSHKLTMLNGEEPEASGVTRKYYYTQALSFSGLTSLAKSSFSYG